MKRVPSLLVVAAVLTLTGCSHTESVTRPEETLQFSPVDIAVAGPHDAAVKLYCVPHSDESAATSRIQRQNRNTGTHGTTPKKKPKECRYIVMDGNALFANAGIYSAVGAYKRRQELMNIVMTVSDLNCSTYLHRVIANRAGFEASTNILESLMNAVSAGTVDASPDVSQYLSLGNLVLGTTVDELTSTYFMNETFQALESIAYSERSRIRREIDEKDARDRQAIAGSSVPRAPEDEADSQPEQAREGDQAQQGEQAQQGDLAQQGDQVQQGDQAQQGEQAQQGDQVQQGEQAQQTEQAREDLTEYYNYDLYERLSDLRRYDDACSMRSALGKLVEVAEKQKGQEEKYQRALSAANDSERRQLLRHINGVEDLLKEFGIKTED